MSTEFMLMTKESLDMFVFLATELTLLFLAISYVVGVLQELITPEKIQGMLSSRRGKGYIIAALLGAITPFCSCSTIPFLKGLLRARAGFGPMLVFLFASPLLNPIIIGLFVVTFGLEVAIFYFLVAMTISVAAGVLLEKLGFERYVKPEAYQEAQGSGCGSTTTVTYRDPIPTVPENTVCCAAKEKPTVKISCSPSSGVAAVTVIEKSPNRWVKIWLSTWKDFKQVFPYLLIGISLGSIIYGFMPTDFIAEFAGEDKWFAIPVAAIIGIPLYIRAEAVIPLSAALVQKGMALGSVMALIIGSAGASLTEVILLKSIFKNQMIIAFLSVILSMAIAAGFLYHYIWG